MDVTHARRTPTAPLTEEEVAGISEHLGHLRRRRDVGDLSAAEYAEQVRTVLERRRNAASGHQPERRRAAEPTDPT